jgi:hypothetical protein
MRLWRRLTRAWKKRPRLRTGTRKLRSLAVGAHVDRLGRIADKEDVGIEEMEDALRLLASEHQATRDEILDIVEAHGLAGASKALSGA